MVDNKQNPALLQNHMRHIQFLYPSLSKPSKIIVTCHQKPDGDAMGSTLGLYHFLIQLGHEVTVISPTNWADFLNWMPGVENVLNFDYDKTACEALIEEAAIIFCLDFNVLSRTKHLEHPIKKANCVKVLIDHHQQPDEATFDYGISNTAKSSTCEMVYDFIMGSEWSHLINQSVARCLYTGVMTDTGSFRFPATGAETHRMVAHLKDLGLEHSPIHSQIFDSSEENRLRFIGFVLLKRMEILKPLQVGLMYVYAEDVKEFKLKTGDTEGLVNYLLGMKGIEMGAIVIDREDERKWSFRSKTNFDVNTFAREHFQGGGHFNAAGGRSDDSVDITVEKFKQILKNYEDQLK